MLARPHEHLTLGLRRRVPPILQSEAAECGIACLAMIAGYYGRRIDLASLRRRFPISLKGTTLASLMDIARRLQLSSRAVRVDLAQLERLRCPCILHWRMSHFVVLASVGTRTIRIHDPASGERKVAINEASAAFTGVALEVWPNPDFKRTTEARSVRLRDLFGRLVGLPRAVSQVLMLAVTLEICAVVSPLFLQWVIDHVLVSADRDLLTTLALGFGLLVLTKEALATLRSWVIMHFSTVLSVQWQANAFAHMLRLPLPYFEKRHLGDIVSRFRSIETIQRTLTSAFVEAIVDGLMTLAIVALLFLYSPALSFVCLAAMALYAVGRWLAFAPLRAATHEQIVHAAKQESHFLETVRGARSIKLFGRQDERRAGWLSLLVDQVNAGLRAQKLQIGFKLLNGLLFGLENVLVIWLGARLVLNGGFSVGMLLAFMAYKGQFAARVSSLIDKYFEVKMLQVQGERLADIVLTEPEAAPSEGRLVAAEIDHLTPTMEVRGLRYRYAEHEAYVLDGVDLAIAAGESVAVVGLSGCGKTTLLHALLGILQPTEGEILIGGARLDHVGANVARTMIGSVTQNDILFAGSLTDNISFFADSPDQIRVEECAKLASIHSEIVAMPMGYNTFVGYMGSVLSGGQQQRVLLARALYKRPKILILDEATSHLDAKREIVVSAALRTLSMTRIIVAHRRETVDTADRVVTLAGGKIVAERIAPKMSGVSGLTLRPDDG